MRNLLRVVFMGLCLLLVANGTYADYGLYNVREAPFNAAGNGVTDDTTAFQNALDQAASDGGGIVTVPTGKYLISTHLTIPTNVTLEGMYRTQGRAAPADAASTLYAVENAGNENGTPFITMNASSAIVGLQILYPNQTHTYPPVAYPWCIRGNGSHIGVRHMLLVNPYKGLDLGTNACDLHTVDGVYMQALYRGFYVDKCSQGGVIENTHLWLFWDLDVYGPLCAFMRDYCIGYQIGKTHSEMITNAFAIFLWVASEYTNFGSGVPSALLTTTFMDGGSYSFYINHSDYSRGINMYNNGMMGSTVVGGGNDGHIKMHQFACNSNNNSDLGPLTSSYIWTYGNSCTSASGGCTFDRWDRTNNGSPAINADGHSLIACGNEFSHHTSGKVKVRLNSNLRNTCIVGNRMWGGVNVQNYTTSGADVIIALNNGG